MQQQAALHRLNSLLPLTGRQQALPAASRLLHQTILRRWFETGSPPLYDELSGQFPTIELDKALARLSRDDLIVLAEDGVTISGAYPLTLEETPHRVQSNGHTLRAMCAVDALAVSPLFGQPAEIRSRCRVTGTPVYIRQNGSELLAVQPTDAVQVGIHWQPPQSCAAHSLCREMVFLADAAAAEAWRSDAPDHRDCFSLPQAVALGADFFVPLLAAAPPQTTPNN